MYPLGFRDSRFRVQGFGFRVRLPLPRAHYGNFDKRGGLRLQGNLGSPVVPFCPFWFGFSLLKPNSRK